MKQFPTLYKKTDTGALQFWEITVREIAEEDDEYALETYGLITTKYGQLGTSKPQVANDTITEGKNIGKANATTPYEQACREAKSKWEKQKKASGYVETKEAALAGEVDALVQGGTKPMLAHKYMTAIYDLRPGHEGEVTYDITPHAKKIKFPAYAQPKLDGIRNLGQNTGDMWSRTRKQFLQLPTLQREIAGLFGGLQACDFADGELYNHAYKNDFEKIASATRQQLEPSPTEHLVEYHVYDVAGPGTFRQRHEYLKALFEESGAQYPHIKLVETILVNNHEELLAAFESFLAQGYEGAMVRNADAPYKPGKGYDLLKLKKFEDDEFEILGFEEGRGKLTGLLGNWICKSKKAAEPFKCPMNSEQDEDADDAVELNTEQLREYFVNGHKYVGKLLTVRYQNYTAYGEPRVPKGHSIRDYE